MRHGSKRLSARLGQRLKHLDPGAKDGVRGFAEGLSGAIGLCPLCWKPSALELQKAGPWQRFWDGCTAGCSAGPLVSLAPSAICHVPAGPDETLSVNAILVLFAPVFFRNRSSRTLRPRRNQEVGISDHTLGRCRSADSIRTEPRRALNLLTRRVPRPEKEANCQTELRLTKVVDENNRQVLISSLEFMSATQIMLLKALAG